MYVAQRRVQYVGFLFFIYQMIIVQLGLSGLRQFVAVSIITYAVTIYVFGNQKYILKYALLILIATSFHSSAFAMFFVLPFIHRLSKWQLFLVIIISFFGLTNGVIEYATEKYDIRYVQGTSESTGAWVRFGVTVFITFFAIKKLPKRLYNLGVMIIVFGIILGLISSVGLHRFNYYFLPISCLLLLKNYKLGNINVQKMKWVYAISIFYFLFWFVFSTHAGCFIPYNLFFTI